MNMPPESANGPSDRELTLLLQDMASGNKSAEEAVWTCLYNDIRERAKRAIRNQPPGYTLQATHLVGAAYEKISRLTGKEWKDRHHFLGYATQVMHSVLVDHARRPHLDREKNPALESLVQEVESRVTDLVAFDEAILRLAEFEPEMAQVARCKAMGISSEDIARSMGLARRTLDRRWSHARAFLHRCIT